MDQYDRYLLDSHALRAVGKALQGASSNEPVRLPSDLAAASLAAWHRDEVDATAFPESSRQSMLRDHAATLALIGRAVEESGRPTEDGVTVQLHPDLFRVACEAVARGDSTMDDLEVRSDWEVPWRQIRRR